MSYTKKTGLGYLVRASNAFDTAEVLSAAAAVYGEYYVTKPCSIGSLRFIVTTTVVGTTTAPVIEVNRRPTPGSASGEVLISQFTIPTSTAAGTVCVERFAPVQLNVGDSLAFEHVTQAVGSAAGAGFFDVELEIDEEADGNQSDLLICS
jgi:hypothetical protein